MLMNLHTSVYVVHMSPILASRLFLNAKRLGMISRGFEIRWSKHLNENQNMQDMELNVYGIWAYDIVQALAKAAERVTTRHPYILHQEARLNMNFTTVLLPQGGLVIMDEMLQSRFQGIGGGGFQLTDGWLIQNEFEIVNVFRGERLIGYWNPENGITSIIKEENHTETNLASSSKLESVIWPGGTKDIPKGFSLHHKRLRIVVPVFPKGSPLAQDISSEGKLQMMENEWFNSTESIFINQDSASNTSRLSLHSFGGLFLITAISSTSALFVCLFQRRKSISVGNLKACLNSGIHSVKGCFKSSICKIMGRQEE
ncbi:hypothetical protein V6N13_064906 [Hibiscus sabdariffa]